MNEEGAMKDKQLLIDLLFQHTSVKKEERLSKKESSVTPDITDVC